MDRLFIMPINLLIGALIFSCTLILSGCGSSDGKKSSEAPPVTPITGKAGDGTLSAVVNDIRVEFGLPAMAVVLVHDGQLIEMAATGMRADNRDIAVSTEDKWHTGSLTKSMTSTLAAVLVKQGVINWHTTIADVYPELVGVMNNQYESIRLDQLLSHTSGMRANTPTLFDYHNSSLDIEIQRQKMLEEALVLSPEVSPGKYLYSNLGYMVAGAMMERVTGTSWEVLLENNVFNTLAMANSGLGVPDVQADFTQPVGHIYQGSGWQAQHIDNPSVLGPAGTVHSSLDDMGKYISVHLAGLRGNDVSGFLSAAEFSKLHTASNNSGYAMGWIVADGS